MTNLRALLSAVDDLDQDGVLHVAPPWSGDSVAACVGPDEGPPHGLTYLLEVDLVHDVAEVWSSWRDGQVPTPDELVDAVIHYAEHDAYLPVEQRSVAERFAASPMPPEPSTKVGIARNVGTGVEPLNALRHPPVGDTSGWYVWAGEEMSQGPDFFDPLHVSHLSERCPDLVRYLELPPGWRVLLAPGQEDVWFDDSLLDP